MGGTQQKMTAFMPLPPTATCLALHPQDNNILAVGLDDCMIVIYNVRNNVVYHLPVWISADGVTLR